MAAEITALEVFEVGPFTNCHHVIKGTYEHTEVGHFIKSHRSWNKSVLRHWESTWSILLCLVGAWNSPRSVWALGVIQPITLQLLFFACLHGICLYPCSLVFRKVFKRTPCRSAALSISSFIAAELCPSHSSCISFQSSHLCLLNSAKSPALLRPSFCDSGQKMDPGRKPGCRDSLHMFLSFLSSNTVPFWTQLFRTCFPVS